MIGSSLSPYFCIFMCIESDPSTMNDNENFDDELTLDTVVDSLKRLNVNEKRTAYNVT